MYGVSSGGALALEGAAAGLAIDRVAVYEVPCSMGEDASPRWREYVEELGRLLAQGRRGDAVELFMRPAGASTLAYDAACLGDGHPPTTRYARVTQPTLVATGGGDDFFEQAADAIAASLPQAERRTVDGQGHVVDPRAFAPVLARFFEAR